MRHPLFLLALLFAFLAPSAWAQIVDQPVNIPTGTQQFNGSIGSATTTTLTIRLKRCTTATPTFWPSEATTIATKMWVSYDGGTTFIEFCGFTAQGGIYIRRDGTEATESAVECKAAPGAGRQIRGEITVVNGPLVSQLTLEAR